MSTTVKFTEAVATILRNSTITESTLKLPGQLSPENYKAVMKVIAAAGGEWDRKAGCHKFQRDPRAVFAEALGEGSIAKPVCAIVDAKKQRQAFYSPAPVVIEVIELVRRYMLATPARILEPESGDGRFVRALAEAFPKAAVSLCEIDDIERAKAAEWGTVLGTDFLAVEPTGDFDLIVMNPPFSKGQDEQHITHARKFLRTGGLLVSVCTPMTGKRATKSSQKFHTEIGQYATRLKLASGSFKVSGTGVETELLILRV
jgi:hypothetical protein